jgi:osmotically inducible lipoprotein OsmB
MLMLPLPVAFLVHVRCTVVKLKTGDLMKTSYSTVRVYLLVAAAIGLSACAGMTEQEKGTAVGAGVGAIGGAVLGGGTLGTIGGAAVGGVIGHEVTKPKK